MILLICLMAIMTLLAAAMIVGPLVSRQKIAIQQDISRDAVNSVVFKDRLRELEQDVANKTISANEFDQLRGELEIGLLSDIPEADERKPEGNVSDTRQSSATGAVAAIILLTAIPLMSFGFYYQEGYNPEVGRWLALREEMEPVFASLMAGEKPDSGSSERSVTEFVTALQRKAQENPDNAGMWHMLGMGYMQMQAAEQAEQALRRAYRIEPENIQYRLALAQLLIEMEQGKLTQESEKLLSGVLKTDGSNMRALAMLGMAEYFAERFPQALSYWERLLILSKQFNAPPEKISILERSIAAAKKRIESQNKGVAVEGVRISVTVDIDPALKSTLKPDDTLFVYAQKAKGPKMPLAAVKLAIDDFPKTILLSDKQAMTPQFRLSDATDVIVKARVSSTNNAIAVSGDYIGESKVLHLNDKEQAKDLLVAVQINAQVP